MILELYNVDARKVPPHTPKQLQRLSDTLVFSEDAWIDKVVLHVEQRINQRRPVLLICEYISIAVELKQYVVGRIPSIRAILYTRDDTEEVFAPSEPLGARDIVFATNLGGRGADFLVTQEALSNGGLHVILTYLPINSRVEEQAFGRTARNGQPGSCEMIMYHLLPGMGMHHALDSDSMMHLFLEELIKARDASVLKHIESVKADLSKDAKRNELFQSFASLHARFHNKLKQEGDVYSQVRLQYARLDLEDSWKLIYDDTDVNRAAQRFDQLCTMWHAWIEDVHAPIPLQSPISWTKMANALAEQEDYQQQALEAYQHANDLDNGILAASHLNRVAAVIRSDSASRPNVLAGLHEAMSRFDQLVEAFVSAHAYATVLSMANSSESTGLQKSLQMRIAAFSSLLDASGKAEHDINHYSSWIVHFAPFDLGENPISTRIAKELKAAGYVGNIVVSDASFWARFGAFFVIGLGILEVIVAVLIPNPMLSSILVQHGVDDLFYGVKHGLAGTFDIEEFFTDKIVRVGLSAIKSALASTMPGVKSLQEATRDTLSQRLWDTGRQVGVQTARHLQDAGVHLALQQKPVAEALANVTANTLAKEEAHIRANLTGRIAGATCNSAICNDCDFEQMLMFVAHAATLTMNYKNFQLLRQIFAEAHKLRLRDRILHAMLTEFGYYRSWKTALLNLHNLHKAVAIHLEVNSSAALLVNHTVEAIRVVVCHDDAVRSYLTALSFEAATNLRVHLTPKDIIHLARFDLIEFRIQFNMRVGHSPLPLIPGVNYEAIYNLCYALLQKHVAAKDAFTQQWADLLINHINSTLKSATVRGASAILHTLVDVSVASVRRAILSEKGGHDGGTPPPGSHRIQWDPNVRRWRDMKTGRFSKPPINRSLETSSNKTEL